MPPSSNSRDVLPIEHELVAERASALGRSGERLEAALTALARLDAELAQGSAAQRLTLASRRRELRAEAAERLWYLIVQREAVGLFHHQGLFQFYRVPPEVRAVAGPRRRAP
jgi:hypothetical protein